uniref:Uncharacterized protein n=1 Tax=Heterorhabditis bacteriophora TaxID=37862 RepID=A0A1I7W966_HETBA
MQFYIKKTSKLLHMRIKCICEEIKMECCLLKLCTNFGIYNPVKML